MKASPTPYRVEDAMIKEGMSCMQDVPSCIQEWTICIQTVLSLIKNRISRVPDNI